MAYKLQINQAIYSHTHYLKNRERRLADNKARKERIKKWMRDYKTTQTCKVCNESHPSCLDFHHRDPSEKKFSISEASLRGYSVETLLKEILKCDVLCANCHRKHHCGGLV